MEVVDSTCPLVKKAHNVIDEFAKQGYDTVIVGDAGHAEVIGLLGYTRGKGIVVANAEEAKKLPAYERVNIVAQTTQKEETFYQIADIIKANAKEYQISNTICEPTKQRQKETIENAKNADLVIVVGGRHSANTARLAKLCGELCSKVIHVESAGEIDESEILAPEKIFITAGASTPNWVTEKVADRVKNLRRKRTFPSALLENLWIFIVKSSAYTSFAAVCLTYVCTKLQNIKADPYLYLLVWLAVFTLTTINKEERVSIFKNKKIYAGVTLAGFIATLTVSLSYSTYVYLPIMLFLLLGLAYPFRHKLKLFSSFPGTKDIVTALGWSFICVYVPAASRGLVFTKSTVLAFTYGLLLVFIRSVILSIGTEHKDIILRRESFYKAFGLTKTKIAITLIVLALTAVLVKLLLMGWKTNIVATLLTGHLYTLGTAVYFYSKRIPRGTLSETIIDGQFYLLALLTFAAVNFI
jgi:4-hydroxy-3-methylbut-2-enyl diphosphate reductase